MSCVLCDKHWQLGVSRFDNEQTSEKDPLATLFESERFSYQNPLTKQSEKRPIFDVIASQSGAENISESFKMFPPVILSPNDIPHGFPAHFPVDLMDFDNKKTLRLDVGEIEDKDAYKRKWFPKLLEHQAESAVSLAFQFEFSGKRGFMIQNYHPETYLQPLVDNAKKQRKNLANQGKIETNQLSPLQEKICQAISCVGPINNESYNKELEDRNRETDNLIVLDEEKLLLVIETKSRAQCQEKCINTLKPAAEKQMKRKQYFMGNHQDILDRDWRCVSIVALPFIDDKIRVLGNQICQQCLDFILDKNDILDFEQWVKRALQPKPVVKEKPGVLVDRSYVNLYNRLVGFMSLSKVFGFSSNVFMDQAEARAFVEESILGAEKSKGVTCEEKNEETIFRFVTGKVLKEKPLSSLQVLYFWYEKQLQFLLENTRLVLFMSDFGVGKTLMMKHKALSVASEYPDEEVIFLSLASSKRHDDMNAGDKFKIYRNPSIFDVACKMDFEGTRVKFVSLLKYPS